MAVFENLMDEFKIQPTGCRLFDEFVAVRSWQFLTEGRS